MMKRTMALLTALAAAPLVQAEVLGSDDRMICGLFEVQECVADDGCLRVSPAEINLRTRFLTVDPERKEIRARGTERTATVDEVIEIGDKLVLAGAQSGEAAGDFGVGYSLTISRSTGHMTLAATGDSIAFIIFGACTVDDDDD